MRLTTRAAALLLLSFFASGCGVFDLSGGSEVDPGEVDGPLLRTSSDAYEVERTANALEVEIPLAFHNESGQAVYINRCKSPQPPVLQKRVGGDWETVYAPPMYDCLGPPVVIDAGEEYVYALEVRGQLRENAAPKLNVDEVEGTYRAEWEINTRFEEGDPAYDPLPLEARVSNTFELVEGG